MIPGFRFATSGLQAAAAMARNSGSAVEYFNLPTNRVIELGTQIEI